MGTFCYSCIQVYPGVSRCIQVYSLYHKIQSNKHFQKKEKLSAFEECSAAQHITCIVPVSQQNSTRRLVFVMQKDCVLCEVRTELHAIYFEVVRASECQT